jgi:MFS superfamily sulfate permease-like transporter
MPQPALAAIVIAAMLHLTKPHYLRDLFVRSRWSFMIAMIVIGAELALGVMHGIALGVVLSLVCTENLIRIDCATEKNCSVARRCAPK